MGRPPTVDVGSTRTGVNVDEDFIRNIARVRARRQGRRGALLRVAWRSWLPGASADTYGVSINGTTSPENQYVIDGLSVNNPGLRHHRHARCRVEFIQEVNVITGGYMPEYGRVHRRRASTP